MYHKRFRGAFVVLHFTVTSYKWEKTNTFCMDLAHLRVLATPSPTTPVTPTQKHSKVRKADDRYPLKQPSLKKARIDEEEWSMVAHHPQKTSGQRSLVNPQFHSS